MTTRTAKRSPGEVTWMDLATPDVEAAKKYYGQIFGWDYFDTGPDFGHYNFALAQGRNCRRAWPHAARRADALGLDDLLRHR